MPRFLYEYTELPKKVKILKTGTVLSMDHRKDIKKPFGESVYWRLIDKQHRVRSGIKLKVTYLDNIIVSIEIDDTERGV